ncbi:MAG: HAD-IIIA family hydrolase [Leptolyngbyaceae cyanobacterium SM1_1_3]|nr:HAD-IIIA family hydrolase [Leptolyngbyaceae cyanobacterium SM1_1_3]NJN04964.1 HAD-IIIA family hydrolase [Leptolyngbyaceae cyanobacterium RM1_1_2]
MRTPFYALVVVTNQSGVARGYFPETALTAVEQRLRSLLPAPLQGFYYCPHAPQGNIPAYVQTCDCRKPAPGLLLRAAAEHGIDLECSWMIGDILNDVEAGHQAGCRSILIDNGSQTEWVLTPRRVPDFKAIDLSLAADYILQTDTHAAKQSNPTLAQPH